MNCKTEDYVVGCHNDIRDFEANLLSTIFIYVEAESALQAVTRIKVSRWQSKQKELKMGKVK